MDEQLLAVVELKAAILNKKDISSVLHSNPKWVNAKPSTIIDGLCLCLLEIDHLQTLSDGFQVVIRQLERIMLTVPSMTSAELINLCQQTMKWLSFFKDRYRVYDDAHGETFPRFTDVLAAGLSILVEFVITLYRCADRSTADTHGPHILQWVVSVLLEDQYNYISYDVLLQLNTVTPEDGRFLVPLLYDKIFSVVRCGHGEETYIRMAGAARQAKKLFKDRANNLFHKASSMKPPGNLMAWLYDKRFAKARVLDDTIKLHKWTMSQALMNGISDEFFEELLDFCCGGGPEPDSGTESDMEPVADEDEQPSAQFGGFVLDTRGGQEEMIELPDESDGDSDSEESSDSDEDAQNMSLDEEDVLEDPVALYVPDSDDDQSQTTPKVVMTTKETDKPTRKRKRSIVEVEDVSEPSMKLAVINVEQGKDPQRGQEGNTIFTRIKDKSKLKPSHLDSKDEEDIFFSPPPTLGISKRRKVTAVEKQTNEGEKSSVTAASSTAASSTAASSTAASSTAASSTAASSKRRSSQRYWGDDSYQDLDVPINTEIDICSDDVDEQPLLLQVFSAVRKSARQIVKRQKKDETDALSTKESKTKSPGVQDVPRVTTPLKKMRSSESAVVKAVTGTPLKKGRASTAYAQPDDSANNVAKSTPKKLDRSARASSKMNDDKGDDATETVKFTRVKTGRKSVASSKPDDVHAVDNAVETVKATPERKGDSVASLKPSGDDLVLRSRRISINHEPSQSLIDAVDVHCGKSAYSLRPRVSKVKGTDKLEKSVFGKRQRTLTS